jgi:hypothetical protein
MSIQIKSAGAWKLVTQPWFRDGTTWTKAIKVWVNVNGIWKESYPLQPGPVTGVVSSTVYRNDRIEIDIDWVAPTSGETATKYLVTASIGAAAAGPFDYTTTVTVNAPTTAVTLTNTTKGFQTYAGKKLYVSIIAQSAAGRNSSPASAAATTVSQLPAPPVPTTYTMTITGCEASHLWTIVTDNRVTGVELATQFNDAPASPVIKRYADNVFGASYQSWNPDTIGAGKAEGMLRTYGPGGVSAWKTVSGTMPGPVAISNYRFSAGKMVVNTSGINLTCQVYTLDDAAGSDWTLSYTAAAGASSISPPASSGWARDNGRWAMLLIPRNSANGWTGRSQNLGWIRKMANPYYVSPDPAFSGGSHTYRNGDLRPEEDQEWQGATASGQNTCYAFYGTRFNAQLNAGYVGYAINCTAAQIALTRVNAGGLGAAVHPRLMLHRAEHGYDDLYHTGAYDTTALARGGSSWCAVPPDWIENLMQSANYRGLGLFHPNTVLSGGASAEYMILVASAYGSLDGRRLFTVRIYHDG